MSTSAGSSETLVKELMVIPCGFPSTPIKVATITPVGKQLQMRQKDLRSMARQKVKPGLKPEGLLPCTQGFKPCAFDGCSDSYADLCSRWWALGLSVVWVRMAVPGCVFSRVTLAAHLS